MMQLFKLVNEALILAMWTVTSGNVGMSNVSDIHSGDTEAQRCQFGRVVGRDVEGSKLPREHLM